MIPFRFHTVMILLLTGLAVTIALGGCEGFWKDNSYTVRNVSDGDTIAVTDPQGTKATVRFACVDAPEVPHTNKEKQSRKAIDKNQFEWGIAAQQRLQDLIQQGDNRVVLTVTDKDRYGRMVSEVRLRNQTLVQEVLVREGLSLIYRPYLKNCPSAEILQQAEAEAKQAKRGIWKDKKFTEPWEYRRLSKAAKS